MLWVDIMTKKLFLLMQDEVIASKLMDITLKHTKLAKEYFTADTMRRQHIKTEIEQLKLEREMILA